jgi:hypothetical protein
MTACPGENGKARFGFNAANDLFHGICLRWLSVASVGPVAQVCAHSSLAVDVRQHFAL